MKFFLTTPLYYVNAEPHIGHSYTNIAADTLARYRRQRLGRENVYFLTGTDEHGQKIARAAQAANLEPQAFSDKMSLTFRQLWKKLNISEDDFIRTTEARHKAAVATVWNELQKKDALYRATYQGFYCTPCETFLTDEYVRQRRSAGEMILCPDCKRPTEEIEESNFFFKLSQHQEWLAGCLEQNEPLKILPESRRNEMLGFLRTHKLEDLCISRPKSRLSWGIESPLSAEHVTYVWFDALINYIAACGYGDPKETPKFKRWWPADVHLIGKDILRQHAIYWPILLHVLGLELPKMIFAHGWWVQDGRKMSKSLGNVTDPLKIVKLYGIDAYRYFLLNETPFGQDGTFSGEALVKRFNSDLANDLGNLVQRTLTMCEKYFSGEIPSGISRQYAGTLRKNAESLGPALEPLMDRLAFSEALTAIWALISAANRSVEEHAPWTLAKQGKTEELKAVIVSLCEVLKITAELVWPFMPGTAETIWAQLGIKTKIGESPLKKELWGAFEKGGRIQKGTSLFPRIEAKK